ncbi:DNA repair protein RecO [Candidatus Nomurabacteria bacterium]|nr:DNA repair protein RecO [Candidatus Nomurabacteria bacterium]
MKTYRTKAIVLRRTSYGEADRVVQFLTPEHGIISVMARGVRREKSKLSGGIELFARSDITVGQGKGELGILTSARLEKFYSRILSNYERMQFGYDAIKQVSKVASQLDDKGFFTLLDETLSFLDNEEVDIRIIKAWFWLQLAILAGYGMNLSTDDNGMKLVEDARYNFSSADQVFVYNENGNYSSDHIKFLRILSAQPPNVAQQVRGYSRFADKILHVAEQAVAR